MALLFPVLSLARQHAHTVQCASQLHQLGIAFIAYSGQNRGALPPWSGWQIAGADGTGEDDEGPGWGEILAPFFVAPTSRVYNCPSFPQEYPFNYFLEVTYLAAHNRVSWNMSEIQHSSNFVLSGDCTGPTLYPAPFGSRTDKTTVDCDKDDAVARALTFALDKEGGLSVHHGGNNVLFADGHVEWKRKFDTSDMTLDPSQMLAWHDVSGRDEAQFGP